MATLTDHLREFGTRSGMGALSLNGDGVCRLVFDGAFTIDVEERDGDACLSGVVGPASGLGPGTLRILLAANLMGDETAGAAIAIDEADDAVVLVRRLPLDDQPYAGFERCLASFVDALQAWQGRLDSLGDEADFGDEPVAPEAGMQIFRL